MRNFQSKAAWLLCVVLAMDVGAAASNEQTTNGLDVGRGVQTAPSDTPDSFRQPSLPRPVAGFKFVVPDDVLNKAINADPAFAFVLVGISEQAQAGFTGAGGGKGYTPTDAQAFGSYLAGNTSDRKKATEHMRQASEWRYSTVFNASNHATEVNVMVRDLKSFKEPIPLATRIYSLTVTSSADSITVRDFSPRRVK